VKRTDWSAGKMRAYVSWKSARQRVMNPKCPSYPHYGGRGITMYPRWADSFERFHKYIGDRPAGTTLERIDVNAGYIPGNVEWATNRDQARNRSNNVRITHPETGWTLCRSDWASYLGTTPEVLYQRERRGWDVKRILDTPVRAWVHKSGDTGRKPFRKRLKRRNYELVR
jgi:hypothetical protein